MPKNDQALVYVYSQCQTCRKALQFLDKHKIPYEARPIVDKPPTSRELEMMLAAYGGQLKKLFNTSGELYRSLQMGSKLPELSTDEALALLAKHGKLIKRPFLIWDQGKRGLVGFKEAEWQAALADA